MGNSGMYQTMTMLAKKVNGPMNLALIVLGTGALLGKAAELGVKQVHSLLPKKVDASLQEEEDDKTYEINTSAEILSNMKVEKGDSFKILMRDDNAVLIEVIGKDNNPFLTSFKLLSSISNVG